MSTVTTCAECGHDCAYCAARHKRAELENVRAERLAAGQAQADTDDAVMLEMRLAGQTLDEIGRVFGLTRERIRQRINRVAPWASEEARRLRIERCLATAADAEARRESERQERITKEGVPCTACGALTLKRNSDDKNATCGGECADVFLNLRNHLDRPDRQYIRPGSETDKAAVTAMQRGMPIFDRLTDEIQSQIRGEAPRIPSYQYLRGLKPKPPEHPCAQCGAPTRRKRFCSRACFYQSRMLSTDHGSPTRYRQGCRCRDCKAAMSAYSRASYLRNKEGAR